MKVYLDNCCYNRPYDSQESFKINMETRAKLHIQEEIKEGKYRDMTKVNENFKRLGIDADKI